MRDQPDDPQTFHCRYCGAVERYDPPEFYLLLWWRASEAFDEQHRDCREQAATS